MITEIPQFGIRAYALFFSKYGTNGIFKQSELNWIVGESMKKKIFALLLRSGWIKKQSRDEYRCIAPEDVVNGILEFRVPEVIKRSEKKYAFTNLSAVEIWSDFSYIQRGKEKSPYFIKVLNKDLDYWKKLFNTNNIPNYINHGSTIGEYMILIPVNRLQAVEKDGFFVERLDKTMKIAGSNEIYLYAYDYMRDKYESASDQGE